MQIKAAQFHVWCPLCSFSRPFLKWNVSTARHWLWSPCLGPVVADSSISVLPIPLQKIKTLILNLMCAAKKTKCWSCALKVQVLSSNSTSGGLAGIKRLTWVTYCMLYVKTHKQTKTLLMLKTIFQLFSILVQAKGIGSTSACEKERIQTFSGGCDAVGSRWRRLQLSLSPTHKGQPQGAEVHLSPGIQEILL